MNYEEFKRTAFYQSLANPMKLTAAMYFADPNSQGLSFSELKRIAKGELSEQEVDMNLDILVDKAEVVPFDRMKKGVFERAYKLDYSAREGFGGLAGLISEGRRRV
jgi:hypothetical protein